MSKRIIAIGDIHGCARAFETLIREIQPATDDLVIPLGDFVDRGPDTARVLDLLVELEDRCQLVSLLGNHEIMLLQSLQDLGSLQFWLECGGMETIDVSPAGRYQFLGHEYFYFHPLVAADLVTLLSTGAGAAERAGLRPEKRQGMTYWQVVDASTPRR